jgi:hypothetical protein
MMGGVEGESSMLSSTRLAVCQQHNFNLDMDHLLVDVAQFLSKSVLFLGWNHSLDNEYPSDQGECKLHDQLV